MKSYLIAGMISGAAGLLVFLAIHHVWIRPIWGILPIGSLLAGLGGLAVGWAYAEIQIGLPPRPWTAAAVFALIAVTLIPGALLTQLRPPPLDITTGTLLSGTPAGIALRFFLELLLTAALVGGLAGWWLGGTTRAGLASATAAFVFALGPGHNIPFLGSTPAAGKGLLLLAAVILVAAVVLVASEAWLHRT